LHELLLHLEVLSTNPSYDHIRIASALLTRKPAAMLTLKPSGLGQPDDYEVFDDVPQPPTSRGYAPTREDAMAAFRAAWDPMPKGKRNVQAGP
jgi:hypothetical protein